MEQFLSFCIESFDKQTTELENARTQMEFLNGLVGFSLLSMLNSQKLNNSLKLRYFYLVIDRI